MMTAAEANGSGLRGKFRELQSECRAMRTGLSAGLVDEMRMAERIIKLEEQLREKD